MGEVGRQVLKTEQTQARIFVAECMGAVLDTFWGLMSGASGGATFGLYVCTMFGGVVI